MKVRLLLSTQRSGSHFLKSFIEASYPGVICTDEILGQPMANAQRDPKLACHPELPLFWPWYQAEAAAGRISVLPDRRMAAFHAYLNMLSGLTGAQDVILDIKYNSIRSLSGYWDTDHGSNDFVSFIRENEIPVLHLIRKNVLRTIVSSQFALQTNQWHRAEERKPGEFLPRVRLNAKNVPFEIRYALKLTEDYQNRFAGHAGYEEIVYEDLVHEQHHAETGPGVRTIGRFLDQPNLVPAATELPYKKTTPENPAEVVENWDEVVRVLPATEYGWMAQPALLAAA